MRFMFSQSTRTRQASKRFNALEAGFARLIGRARTPWSIPERCPDTEIIIEDVSLSDTVVRRRDQRQLGEEN